MSKLTWTPVYINTRSIPTLRQPVYLHRSVGVSGVSACRHQSRYLSRTRAQDVKEKVQASTLFTTDGAQVPVNDASRYGVKWGQERLVLSPLVTDGLPLEEYAARLSELWGLGEFGWYAATHYDTPHPHVHFVLETEADNGAKVSFDNKVLSTWLRHAEKLSTDWIGLYQHNDVAMRKWEQEYV